MKKKIWGIIFFIGCVFIFAGAVNAGFSRYFMAVPFMVLILFISKWIFQSSKLLYFSIFFIVLAILINYTQTNNPFLFPIVHDGYATALKDGYQETFSDGSGGFSESDKEDIGGLGPIAYTKINKGDRYMVKGVRINNPEFSENFSVVTEIGEFGDYDYPGLDSYNEPMQLNKPVRAEWAATVSKLMYWPLLLFFWK